VAVPLISALVALLSEAIMPRQLQSDAASAEAEAEAEAEVQLAMTVRSMLEALLDASSGADVDVLSTSLARQPSSLPQVGRLSTAVRAHRGRPPRCGRPLGSLRASPLARRDPRAGRAGRVALQVNSAGARVSLGTSAGFTELYYCGRTGVIDTEIWPSGRCGPSDGPQCASCKPPPPPTALLFPAPLCPPTPSCGVSKHAPFVSAGRFGAAPRL
jgi:hypothetical protein